MIFKILLFFIIIFNNSLAREPDWYREKPGDDKLYIYSTGCGDDISEAITNALNNIVDINENYSDNIHINFSNYTIKRSERIDNMEYILIRVKRNELFNLQIDNLKIINDAIEKKFANLPTNSFKKISEIRDIEELINLAQRKIEIIKQINEFSGRKFTKRYKQILKELDKNILYLAINIDNSELLPLNDRISEILEKHNIIVDEKSENILVVKIENNKQKLHNSFLVNTKITLSIEENGDIVKYAYKNYTSEGSGGFDAAFRNNLKSIEKDLDDIFLELLKM